MKILEKKDKKKMDLSKFPLVNMLFSDKKLSEKPLTAYQKKDLMEKINNMTEEEHQRVYAIIRIYNFTQEEKKSSSLYDAAFEGNDIKFSLNNLPPKLCHILRNFYKLSQKKKKEDEKLEKERNRIRDSIK